MQSDDIDDEAHSCRQDQKPDESSHRLAGSLCSASLPVERRLRSRIDKFLTGFGLTPMGTAVALSWIQVCSNEECRYSTVVRPDEDYSTTCMFGGLFREYLFGPNVVHAARWLQRMEKPYTVRSVGQHIPSFFRVRTCTSFVHVANNNLRFESQRFVVQSSAVA